MSTLFGKDILQDSLKTEFIFVRARQNIILASWIYLGPWYRLETFFSEEENHTQAPRWASNRTYNLHANVDKISNLTVRSKLLCSNLLQQYCCFTQVLSTLQFQSRLVQSESFFCYFDCKRKDSQFTVFLIST